MAGPKTTHTYTAPGIYTVRLTVTDDDMETSEAMATIVVEEPNIPPVASFFASPEGGPAPLSVSFDASGSSDPDGVIENYRWDFGDGTVEE